MHKISRRKDYLYITYGYARSKGLNHKIRFNCIKTVNIEKCDIWYNIVISNGVNCNGKYIIKVSTQLQAEQYRDLINRFTSEWHQKQYAIKPMRDVTKLKNRHNDNIGDV